MSTPDNYEKKFNKYYLKYLLLEQQYNRKHNNYTEQPIDISKIDGSGKKKLKKDNILNNLDQCNTSYAELKNINIDLFDTIRVNTILSLLKSDKKTYPEQYNQVLKLRDQLLSPTKLSERYDPIVKALKSDKNCMNVYMNTKFTESVNGVKQQLESSYAESNIKFQAKKIFDNNVINSDNVVAIGSIGLLDSEIHTELTNMYDLKYTYTDPTNSNTYTVESFRYGTPIKHDMRKQSELIKNYINKSPDSKAIVISLLDMCTSIVCKIGKKDKETAIIRSEIETFSPEPNIVYFNCSINSNVNRSYTGKSSIDLTFINKLKGWIDLIKSDILKIKAKKLFNTFLTDIVAFDLFNNQTPDLFKNHPHLNTKIPTLKHGEQLILREGIRYYLICFLILIHNLLILDGQNVKLLYHCKSGQDRTGTFYAINQMCLHVFFTKKTEILEDINKLDDTTTHTDILNLLIKYFSYIDTNNKTLFEFNLYPSYLITWFSTGVPGLKWSLGKTEKTILVENRFAYMITPNVISAVLLEGKSSIRGS